MNELTDSQLLAIVATGSIENSTNHGNMLLEMLRKTNVQTLAVRLTEETQLKPNERLRITACAELLRRNSKRSAPRISSPQDVYSLCRHLSLTHQEHFISMSLNGAHDVIALRTVTIGLVNRAQTHPREIFAEAIVDRATALIVAHNHPSNNLEPSKADLSLTERLSKAGQLLGIPLLDHIIFGAHNYVSLREITPQSFCKPDSCA